MSSKKLAQRPGVVQAVFLKSDDLPMESKWFPNYQKVGSTLAMASHANFIIVQYMGLPSGNPT